jgi:hypothetical protein
VRLAISPFFTPPQLRRRLTRRCSDTDRNWLAALGVQAGIPGGLKGRGVSADPGEVRTRASSASERAQRVAGAEIAEGFQLFPLTPPLGTAYLNTTLTPAVAFNLPYP